MASFIPEKRGASKPLSSIFGKEAAKAEVLCKGIMEEHMYKTSHPRHPVSLFAQDVGKTLIALARDFDMTVVEYVKDYNTKNPEEIEAYNRAMEAYELACEKRLITLYGMAKRHHLFIEWCGNNKVVAFPDRFLVHKGGKLIGMIQC